MPQSATAQPAAPKRRGNPNLHLAPRCGARTRAGCACLAPAIRGKLRCRMHGGRSTGPRTAEGMARLRAARTTHGAYSAQARAAHRCLLGLLRRTRVAIAAVHHRANLPPELVDRLNHLPPEFTPPPYRTTLTPAEDRAIQRAEAEALAPWKQAIAEARTARRRAATSPPSSAGRSTMTWEEAHAPEPPPVAQSAPTEPTTASTASATARPDAPEQRPAEARSPVGAPPTAESPAAARPLAPERPPSPTSPPCGTRHTPATYAAGKPLAPEPPPLRSAAAPHPHERTRTVSLRQQHLAGTNYDRLNFDSLASIAGAAGGWDAMARLGPPSGSNRPQANRPQPGAY